MSRILENESLSSPLNHSSSCAHITNLQSQWFYTRGLPAVATTFRTPTPLLVFQTVLIPGVFLSGFLLSPLLVLSRHIAQKPSHRLKVLFGTPLAPSCCIDLCFSIEQWPTERETHRKLLAAGVFVSLFGIVTVFLGGWAGWMLGGGFTRPWTWAIEFIIFGDDGLKGAALSSHHAKGWSQWRRPMLIAYWAATIVVAVGGWQTRLVRARRIHLKSQRTVDKSSPPPTSDRARVGVESAREEKRVHASLNMRRKFFHALAVMMFVPGIIVDVSVVCAILHSQGC